MKVGLIVTILNEEKSIVPLLESIFAQTVFPDEVVIVDGGSSDNSLAAIAAYRDQNKQELSKTKLLVLQKKGNRSVGRNYAVSQLKTEWIACTDAGCILEPTWLQELCAKQLESHAVLVAGYYKPLAKSLFEQAVACYALVKPSKLEEFSTKVFLPATRSLLISKKIFQKIGGFDERLSDNEDYAFAKKMELLYGKRMAFAPAAVVLWRPVSTLGSFAKMIYRFARGDTYAGILRPKVLTVFGRYLVFILIALYQPLWFLAVFVSYVTWAIAKNADFAGKAWYFLPILQLVSDIAVMAGSVHGQFLVIAAVLSVYKTRQSA